MITTEQAARNAAGLAACRGVVDEALAHRATSEPEAPTTASEQIRRRALARAAEQRRAERMGANHPADPGVAA